jgi:hypothetical protein
LKNNNLIVLSFKKNKIKAELHVVSEDYAAQKPDELTVKRSEFVEVLAKSITGFWKVK